MFQAHALILLLSLAVCCARVTRETCDPECVKADTFVPDPYSCESYYYCISPGTPSGPYTCPTEKIFDINVKPNHDTPAEPCKATTTCTAICEVPVCQIACKAAFEVIINPTDCEKFSVCIPVPGEDNTFTHHEDDCPDNRPYFNGADCTAHQEDCCNVCEPNCDGENYGVQIPDPKDCNKYYTCLGPESDPNITGPDTCLGEAHFDIGNGKCVPGKDCKNLCDPTSASPPTGSPTESTTEPSVST